MAEENNILSDKGWKFPPEFTVESGPIMVNGLEEIEQSMRILMSTGLNERIMRENYGCNLSQFIFREIDEALLTEIRSTIADAVEKYEPRVQLIAVDVWPDEYTFNLVNVTVKYNVIGYSETQTLTLQQQWT